MADWQALGDRAIRFARPARPARALVDAIRAWPGVIDVVVARDDVAAYFAGPPVIAPGAIAALAALPTAEPPARTVTLRARYDGADLAEVAARIGGTVDDVIALHAGATYTVETLGFAPGFAYLVGVPAPLALPRRATPRPRVPAGAIAIAGGYTAVYPFASPGGWHLLGNVIDTPMFSAAGPALALGDRVRFAP